MPARYLEDYVPGTSAEFGSARVTEEEIRMFAERYDPQPFHIDPQAAAATPYGGLIASGWQTAAIAMRMVVDHYIDGETSLGSPGIGALRWRLPVRPGDELHVRARVTGNRPSESKPDRGVAILEVEVLNQNGEVVMSIEDWVAIVRRRPAAATLTA
jgi:acyl dehydratase